MAHTSISGPELILRTRWYINLRWFVLLSIIVPGLTSIYLVSGWGSELRSDSILAIILLTTNAVFFGLARVPAGNRYYRLLALSLLLFDILFVTYFIYSKGAIESRSPILYVLPIMMSATLLGRKAVYLTAIMAITAYNTLITLDYLDIIHAPGGLTHLRDSYSYLISTTIFFSAILFNVAVLADFITRLLIQKERQASSAVQALRQAQEIAKLGSWEWDIPTDKLTLSDELLRIFGLEDDSGLNYAGYIGLLHPDDKQRAIGNIKRALKKGSTFNFTHRIVRADESLVVVHGEGQVVRDRAGKATKMLGTGQDITAERALEGAKGDFVALASHQLRTPATGVKMLLALVLDGYDGELNPEQHKTLLQAYEANERQLKIANDLLNVAKLESGRLLLQRQNVDIAALVRTIANAHRLVIKTKQQRLKLELPRGSVMILADAERIAMAIDNLLSNAMKYTPAGGTITISLVASKASVRIGVADTGIGIASSESMKLFHRFVRLDNQASRGVEGSGLGLYLVKSIVDLHKGTVRVYSKPGVGSKFTVRLPKGIPVARIRPATKHRRVRQGVS